MLLVLTLLVLAVAVSRATASPTFTWIGGSNADHWIAPVYRGAKAFPGSRTGSSAFGVAGGNTILAFGESLRHTLGDLFTYNEGTNAFAFLSGSNASNHKPSYGIRGTPSKSNDPGARSLVASWSVGSSIYIFGGSAPPAGSRNDLWRYDTGTGLWTWLTGDTEPNSPGNYTAGPLATPGARDNACAFASADGAKLYLYGGVGYDTDAIFGFLGDLWVYTTATNSWKFVSGDKSADVAPTYGGSRPRPGGRSGCACWALRDGGALLFGGFSFNITYYSDVWRITPSTGAFSFVGGTKQTNVAPDYAANRIGSRAYAAAVAVPADAAHVYLFAGKLASGAIIGDLWALRTADYSWSYLAGNQKPNAEPVYGKLGVPAPSNDPGARDGVAAWSARRSNSRVLFYGGVQRSDLWAIDL